MTVVLEVPEDIAKAFAPQGDMSKRTLESVAVEGFRLNTLTQMQVGRLLGLSRVETEDFLASHLDLYSHDPMENRREAAVLEDYTNRKQLP